MPIVFQKIIDPAINVGVWHIEEEESYFNLPEVLPKTIGHPQKRKQHLAGRYLLTILHDKLPLHNIRISETNKPFLLNDECHFSISHCKDYAAAVVCESASAGIDIEVVSEKALKLSFKFMNEAEHSYLNGDEAHDRKIATAIWSIKEAVFKWYGKGEVSFKNHVLVQTYPDPFVGCLIKASFTKEGTIPLKLELRWVENYSLVWICQ